MLLQETALQEHQDVLYQGPPSHNAFGILRIEPEDSIDIVLMMLRQQSKAMVLVLPPTGSAFSQQTDFTALRRLQDEEPELTILGIVLTEEQMPLLGPYAAQQRFLSATSTEALLRASLQSKQPARRTDALLASPGTSSLLREPMQGDNTLEAQWSINEQETPGSSPLTPLPEQMTSTSRLINRQPQRHLTQRRRWLLLALLVGASLLVVLSATLLTAFTGGAVANIAGPTLQPVGSLTFTSSGLLDPTSSQGVNDQLSLGLHVLSLPSQGQSDYAWLLPDPANDEVKPLLLGTLFIHGGHAHLDYKSPDHTNLLALYSQFRVTEQKSTVVPTIPSPDPGTWQYSGAISNTPTPGDEHHYSLLAHMRHLLATDPTLTKLGLSGGLDIWLLRNTQKLLEYATAARDDWPNLDATALVHRHIIRLLDELDGETYVWQDVPAGTPFLIDPKAGRIGLLEVNPNQALPGYLDHVDLHLQGLANAPGHTIAQQQLAIAIDHAVTRVRGFMQIMRKDARELVSMNNDALRQQHALDLINDIVSNANLAYVGQADPTTGENADGVVWIHNKIALLATMPILVTTKG